jgi:hypothetical protein
MGGRQTRAAAEAVVFPLVMMVGGVDDDVNSRKLFVALGVAAPDREIVGMGVF